MRYTEVLQNLRKNPQSWLVTGAGGFIGSHLVERLIGLGQTVFGLDNFATGNRRNLDEVRISVGEEGWGRFRFIEGDICDLETCRRACEEVNYVLHQAALGSVPRSIDDPVTSNQVNVNGFLNMLVAARDAGVMRFIYAASSSTYGDHPALPKAEENIGKPLSPYAVTKYVNELYANVFLRCYGLETVGLRYFNVFGPRQDPNGAYAAVIPRWFAALVKGEPCFINGDGTTSRDFCYIENVVQANLLAATAGPRGVAGKVFNVAVGDRTTLDELFQIIRGRLLEADPQIGRAKPIYRNFRVGDVRHSQADISKARDVLGYRPEYSVRAGIAKSAEWYLAAGLTAGEHPSSADA